MSAIYRDYSMERKAEVLALLDANEGNLKRTAAETGIDHSTIRYWVDNRERFAEIQAQKSIDLAAKAEHNAHLLANSIAEHNLETATLAAKATAFGVMVDKMQLLRNQPTSITETVQRTEISVLLTSVLDVEP